MAPHEPCVGRGGPPARRRALRAGVAQRTGGRWVMRSFGPVDKHPLRRWQIWRAVIFVGRWAEGDDPPLDAPH